jgi:hypothetical protein
VESVPAKLLLVSTASAAKRAILPTLILFLRPLLMYVLKPGGGDVSMDMSKIVVEVEEDTKDCFFFLAAVAGLAVAVWLGTGIGMDSVLLRGND